MTGDDVPGVSSSWCQGEFFDLNRARITITGNDAEADPINIHLKLVRKNMKTYDVIVNQDGQKFTIYNQPESIIRELGLGEPRTVADSTQKRNAGVDPGTTTLQQLYDDQHFSRGSADPPKKTVWNPPSDEYSCKVDRVKGTVGDDR